MGNKEDSQFLWYGIYIWWGMHGMVLWYVRVCMVWHGGMAWYSTVWYIYIYIAWYGMVVWHGIVLYGIYIYI